MVRARRPVLFAVFFATGFAALSLQVVWQRVISLHAGVDLASFTTVVAAFLAGLGLGSIIGGQLADRLGSWGSARVFAVANLALGVFSWVSLWFFYDLYRTVAPSLGSTAATFAFNAVLLIVPTTLMGISTPLVAKAAGARAGTEAGVLVGRLYAVNTLGAAFGAAVTGWYLQGTFGFLVTVRLAGTLQLIAGLVTLLLLRTVTDGPALSNDPAGQGVVGSESDPVPHDDRPPIGVESSSIIEGRAWPWFVVYGATGAVALGFETVFFRVIDTIMRSNSYSFGHVLSLYLLLFATGAAAGSRLLRRRRPRRPEVWFLVLQFGVGLAAVAGIVVLVRLAPHTPWAEAIRAYFEGEGFSVGFTQIDGAAQTQLIQVFVLAPLLVMAVPVILMGASYPFIMAVVARRPESLGRRTGTLLAANIVGNVAGTLITGFVLIDRFGTAGTYRILTAVLALAGVGAAWLATPTRLRRRWVSIAVVVALAGFGVRAMPSNQFLYASLHGTDVAGITLVEDRSCANALRHLSDGSSELTVNGAAQNRYPFDDFHVLVGMAPAIAHPQPRRAMALGFGIGATPYGLASDPRLEQIDSVELCGGELPLLRQLGDDGAPELARLFADGRQRFTVGDGRDHLLRTPDGAYDVVVVDTLRSHAAFSGNLYSEEFYALVRSRLASGGILAQWVASPRVLSTVTRVFPYVVTVSVGTYFGSTFFLASDRPIEWNRDAIRRRVTASGVDERFPVPGQPANINSFFDDAVPACVVAGAAAVEPVTPDQLNTDLRPRDEYFLNNAPPPGDSPPVGRCP